MVTCEFCGNTYDLGGAAAPMNEDVKQGLKMLTRMEQLLNLQPDDLDTPAEKPFNTKVALENHPGHSFRAAIPAAGFSLRTGFLAMFTTVWCSFMLVWNGIAIAQGIWIMLLFGLLHDAVGVFLLLKVLWALGGKEELVAQGETFKQIKKFLFWRSEKSYPLTGIDDVIIRQASRENNTVHRGLYLLVGAKKQRIASNAVGAELRWIRKELLDFFKPRW